MTTIEGKIIQIGNSLGITIPTNKAKELYLIKGDKIKINIELDEERRQDFIRRKIDDLGIHKEELLKLLQQKESQKNSGVWIRTSDADTIIPIVEG
jgi:antitoxin component of MazEF toxin-antitoxin module